MANYNSNYSGQQIDQSVKTQQGLFPIQYSGYPVEDEDIENVILNYGGLPQNEYSVLLCYNLGGASGTNQFKWVSLSDLISDYIPQNWGED